MLPDDDFDAAIGIALAACSALIALAMWLVYELWR